MRLMASDYEGFDEADLAHHIANSLTQLTGRVWNTAANERLAIWLVDSVNRSMAVQWLVYVDEGKNPQSTRLRSSPFGSRWKKCSRAVVVPNQRGSRRESGAGGLLAGDWSSEHHQTTNGLPLYPHLCTLEIR